MTNPAPYEMQWWNPTEDAWEPFHRGYKPGQVDDLGGYPGDRWRNRPDQVTAAVQLLEHTQLRGQPLTQIVHVDTGEVIWRDHAGTDHHPDAGTPVTPGWDKAARDVAADRLQVPRSQRPPVTDPTPEKETPPMPDPTTEATEAITAPPAADPPPDTEPAAAEEKPKRRRRTTAAKAELEPDTDQPAPKQPIELLTAAQRGRLEVLRQVTHLFAADDTLRAYDVLEVARWVLDTDTTRTTDDGPDEGGPALTFISNTNQEGHTA